VHVVPGRSGSRSGHPRVSPVPRPREGARAILQAERGAHAGADQRGGDHRRHRREHPRLAEAQSEAEAPVNYFMAPEPRGLRRRGFGAEQEHGTEDIATSMKKCGENLKNYDYDSAAGRRAANKEAGRCSAEAVCTYFSQGAVPPGICGPIGAQIAEWVGAAFETIFGTDEYAEWLKNYQARQGMENEAALISAKLDAVQAILDAAVETATAAMIVAWDSSGPDARGRIGGGQELTSRWDPKILKG